MSTTERPRGLVVMGPSGCGKTTLAHALAQSLGVTLIEADDLHPPANVQKMRSGVPLDDADRAPWLDAVAQQIAGSSPGVVATCSALKRSYRDRLRAVAGPLFFILPQVPRATLARRLAERSGHYMPASLLDSQLAALEPLAADEYGCLVDGEASVESQVQSVRGQLPA